MRCFGYPEVGEVVNIAKYGNQFYYYLPLNLHKLL